jgi:tetratricopeptide (TPR) repeat protein
MRLVFSLALLLVVTATAHADERAKAREAFRLGRQHYALREYKEALTAFQEAYRHYEDPSFLFNIAQCERQLDHRAEAIRAYRMYLVNASDAGNREEVRQIIAKLEHDLDAEHAAQAAKAPPPPTLTPTSAPTPTPTPPPATTVTATTTTATTNGSVLIETTKPARPDKPAYKKWWVWTLVGVAVAGGAAAGLAVGLTRNNGSSPTAMTSFGTASPF